MTLRDLRSLLESPFRNYANFSGRAGRAEFWLFLLSLFVATNLAWIIGYGGMMLAGYQSHDHRYETYHHTHAPDDDPGTNGPSLSHMGHEGHDSPVIFKFHRHSSEEGYHLHGSIDAEHFLDEDHRRDDAKGRAGKRRTPISHGSSEDGMAGLDDAGDPADLSATTTDTKQVTTTSHAPDDDFPCCQRTVSPAGSPLTPSPGRDMISP